MTVDNNIQRDLGRLESKVDHLLAKSREAEEAHEDTTRRLEAIERKQEATAGAVASLAPRVVKGEEAAASLDRLQTIGKGYLMGVGVGSAVAGGGFVLWMQDTVAAFFKALWK